MTVSIAYGGSILFNTQPFHNIRHAVLHRSISAVIRPYKVWGSVLLKIFLWSLASLGVCRGPVIKVYLIYERRILLVYGNSTSIG